MKYFYFICLLYAVSTLSNDQKKSNHFLYEEILTYIEKSIDLTKSIITELREELCELNTEDTIQWKSHISMLTIMLERDKKMYEYYKRK